MRQPNVKLKKLIIYLFSPLQRFYSIQNCKSSKRKKRRTKSIVSFYTIKLCTLLIPKDGGKFRV